MSRPVALVTGGRRGIGRAIAERLAADGYDVGVLDLVHDADMDDALAAIATAGGRAHGAACDLADLGSHPAALEALESALGPVDLLVNNAGRGSVVRGDLMDLKPENFDTVLGVNLRGTMFLTNAVVRRMLAREGDRRAVVTVTSVSAEAASPECADYCISKAGLSMYVKALAVRLAGTGIGVFEVRPGIIKTEMTAAATEKYDRLIAAGLVPEGRWGFPEDVAAAVSALASGNFAFSQGQVVTVDGGLTLPRF